MSLRSKISVLVVEPARALAVELPANRPMVVGRGPGAQVLVRDAKWSVRELALTAQADGLRVEPLPGSSGVRVNEVPVSSAQVLRAGDEVRLGDVRLLVLVSQETAVPARQRLATAEELLVRLGDEMGRAGAREGETCVGWVVVSLPPLNTPARAALLRRLTDETVRVQPGATWGELGPQLWGAVVPETSAAVLVQLAKRLVAAAPRGKVVLAVRGPDGLEAEALVAAAFRRLHPTADDEVHASDPVQVRLLDALEAMEGALLVVEGASGSGRATIARRWLEARGARKVREVHAGDLESLHEAWDSPAALVVRDAGPQPMPPRLPPTALTTKPGWGSEHGPLRLVVPPLVDRPREILPLAELFLSRARAALGRPRLVLAHDAQAALARAPWPGQVRELENAVWLAAHASVRDEVGRDALPWFLSRDAPQADLRGSLHATERTLLLEALARTRWNVTQAANRLGLPRRTVVYRMARLGLKRPARHGPGRGRE